jgi:hypothetical protein
LCINSISDLTDKKLYHVLEVTRDLQRTSKIVFTTVR